MKSKIFFIGCCFVLMCMGVSGQLLMQNGNLQGETVTEERVGISFENIWSGRWQTEYEEYFADNLKIREWLIPVRNQIMYSVFKTSPNNNIVIGKNQNLYEEEYVCFETQIYQAMAAEEVDELVDKLKKIDTALKKKGKSFFIFITPSKAEIYYEDVPENYLLIAPDTKNESTYSLFIKALSESSIAYYDSTPEVRRLKEISEFHVFPRTGTHWSCLTAAICAEKLADSMEEQLSINLPECMVEYEQCEEPVFPDTDIYDVLNLWEKPDEAFYKPIVEITDEDKGEYTILARGGSFMGASLNRMIQENYFSKSYYIENTFAVCPEGTYSGNFDSYDILPVREMIEDSDIIFLEVNEEAIPRMSFGFIDYILDNNILGEGGSQ